MTGWLRTLRADFSAWMDADPATLDHALARWFGYGTEWVGTAVYVPYQQSIRALLLLLRRERCRTRGQADLAEHWRGRAERAEQEADQLRRQLAASPAGWAFTDGMPPHPVRIDKEGARA